MITDTSRPSMTEYAHLLPPSWKSTVNAWIAEDAPSFDWGGYVVGEAPREAFLLGKGRETAVLAGVPFVDEIFAQLGCQFVLVYSCPRFN
jgi:nicotinate-nucleotide pyrophosphorylase (carboxylating)